MTRGCKRRNAEEGSVVTAILVVMIIGALAATMFTFSQASARGSVRQEIQRSVIDGVDAGIAHASARIEQGERASFTGSSAVDDVRYTYRAERRNALDWTISVEATHESEVFGVSARSASARMVGRYDGDNPYALFTSTGLSISTDAVAVSEPIGSNGRVTVAGPAQDLIVHTFAPSGSCSGCRNAIDQSPAWPVIEPATPATSRACPHAILTESNGRQSRVYGFLGTLDGRNGVPFRCTRRDGNDVFGHYPTIIYQTINIVNPPVIIHVDATVTLWFLRANVNPGGDPRDFVVEAVGGPTDANGYEFGRFFEDGTTMTGILNAPSRQVRVETGVNITGAMTVGSLEATANSLEVTADPRVVDNMIDWTISDWRTIQP